MSVMAEGEEPWAGVELAAQNIEEMNPAAPLIESVDFVLVNAVNRLRTDICRPESG